MKFHLKGIWWFLAFWVSGFSFAQNFKIEDLSYPYEVKKLRLQGNIELAYTEEGKGEQVLLFIHGLGSYLPVWKNNIETLKKSFRCIVVDLPGYGKSSKGDYPQTMTFYAQTLLDFIEKLKLKNVVPVGHSMGGQIALTMALKQPLLFKRMVLIAPAGLEEFKEEQGILLKNFTTADFIKNTSDAKIRSNLAANFCQYPKEADFMAEDRIKMKGALDFEAYCRAVAKSVAGMIDEPVFQKLDQIQGEALIIFGENDGLIPNKFFNPGLTTLLVAKNGTEKIKKSKLLLIPQAGHLVQFEKPKECNEAIAGFLLWK